MRVAISAKDFKTLINGGTIKTVEGAEIALGEDVGWAQIFTIVTSGFAEANKVTAKRVEKGY